MSHPARRTPFCELVGVRHPIVQTGMGYVSDARLTAATAEAGGLGILAGVTMDFAALEAAVRAVKAATDKPFGVNMRAEQPDAERRIELLAREGVRVASFAGAPRPALMERLKAAGILVMPSIGARRHAEKVVGLGADIVLVQGAEGGGHTGQVPTSLLLPQVVDAVDVPVVAAGGLFDGRGLVSALAYGASGIAMGTRFMLTRESPVAEAIKQVYLDRDVTDTVVTREVDGIPQRVLRTELVEDLLATKPHRRVGRALRNAVAFKRLSGSSWPDLIREALATKRSRELGWGQILMAANAPMLYRAGLHEGRTDVGVLASGQVVGLIHDLPSCAELIERIVAEAISILDRLTVAPEAADQ